MANEWSKQNPMKSLLVQLIIPLIGITSILGFQYWGDFRDQRARDILNRRGIRTAGYIDHFEGKGENIAIVKFEDSRNQSIDAHFDMTSTPERSKILWHTTMSVIYDPYDPQNAIPEPFSRVPPIDIWGDLSGYVWLESAIYCFFIVPLAIVGAWRDGRIRRVG